MIRYGRDIMLASGSGSSLMEFLLMAKIISEETALYELGLLYNHKQDDSPQFTRWQMIVAMSHGFQMALAASAGDMTKSVISRPAEPAIGAKDVRYRGWECGYNTEAALWGCEGWEAYLGGPDIDAPKVSGRTWAELLDEIDAHDLTEPAA